MNTFDTFAESLDLLHALVDSSKITAAGDAPTPCRAFTVSDLFDHIIDTHNLLIGAAGGEPVALGGTPKQLHRAARDASLAAWSERGTDGTIDIGGNELPAAFGLSLHTVEAYIHAWDLAQGLGVPFEPTTGLTASVWELAQQVVPDEARGDFDGAPYGPAVDVADDADPVARLVAHAGRNPYEPAAAS